VRDARLRLLAPPGELNQTSPDWFCVIGSIYMTSFTKPEINNILHCCQRRTATASGTCTDHFVTFGHVVFEICEWKVRQTDVYRHVYRNNFGGEVMTTHGPSWRADIRPDMTTRYVGSLDTRANVTGQCGLSVVKWYRTKKRIFIFYFLIFVTAWLLK